jgi:hypothetical protein
MDRTQRIRLSPAGVVLAVVLVVGLAALFLASSHTVQLIGFIIVVVVGIVLLADLRPRGSKPHSISAFLMRVGPDHPTKAGQAPEQAWIDPEALYREREEQERRTRGRGA